MRHRESELQRACVRWFRYRYPRHAAMLIAVPNGAPTTEQQRAILKAEGMLAGVADLLLLVPAQGYSMLAIEMKTDKGRQSPAQQEWQREAERHGIRYEVVRSFDDFNYLIEPYIRAYESGN